MGGNNAVTVTIDENDSGNYCTKTRIFEGSYLELPELLTVFEQALAGAGFIVEGKELRLVDVEDNTE